MVEPSLGAHLLRLEDLSVTPGAVGGLALLAGDDRRVGGARVLAGPGQLVAAHAAVDVVVGTNRQDRDVEVALALATREALPSKA